MKLLNSRAKIGGVIRDLMLMSSFFRFKTSTKTSLQAAGERSERTHHFHPTYFLGRTAPLFFVIIFYFFWDSFLLFLGFLLPFLLRTSLPLTSHLDPGLPLSALASFPISLSSLISLNSPISPIHSSLSPFLSLSSISPTLS
jgi:hypothetical protein